MLRWLLGGELRLCLVYTLSLFIILQWDWNGILRAAFNIVLKKNLFLAPGLDLILVFATVTSITGTKSGKRPLVPTQLSQSQSFATNTCLSFAVPTMQMLRTARTNTPSRKVGMGKSCNLQSVWSPGWSLRHPDSSN